eukprot:TRINITY_DN28232_c0_g1_i1.p1 TRINITY_DN28232_c0_g1~~TRINITY_DN28232_c0_g1_i1.p1  ORF type:complete len:514 (-),score=132.70 TRINITY_DN28232_c0_g1_i1:73-1536(-)
MLATMQEELAGEIFLTIEEVTSLLRVYRKAEGITVAEKKELFEIFKREQEDNSMGALELGRLLRWFGISTSLQEVQRIIEDVDFDGSGRVEFEELLKVLRVLRQDEARKRHRIFDSIDTSGWGFITAKKLVQAMTVVMDGAEPPVERLQSAICSAIVNSDTESDDSSDSGSSFAETSSDEDFDATSGSLDMASPAKSGAKVLASLKDSPVGKDDMKKIGREPSLKAMAIIDGAFSAEEEIEEGEDPRVVKNPSRRNAYIQQVISFADFENIFAAYRVLVAEIVRRSAGFMPAEVKKLQMIFHTYDRKGSSIVEGAELRRLIAENVPEAIQTKDGHRAMQVALQEVAPAGCLTFDQFLWLMRRWHDQRDERDIVEEANIVRSSRLSLGEVEGYRELFSASADWAGEVSYEAIKKMLSRVHSFTIEEEEALARLMRKLSQGGRLAVRFPQFLTLMQTITQEESQWGGLNTSAARALRRAEPRRRADHES